MMRNLTLNQLARLVHTAAVDQGAWDDVACRPDEKDLAFRLALIYGEVGQALGALLSGAADRTEENGRVVSKLDPTAIPYVASGQPEGFLAELADVVLRVLDVCGACGFDIDGMVALKATYAEAHGGGGAR